MGQRAQRQYAYLDCRPQQELGHMKKRVKPPGSTYANPLTADNDDCFGLIKYMTKHNLTKEIVQKYQEEKSIVPTGNNTKERASSIKIVHQEPCTGYSGAYYLIHKSTARGSGHAERKHVVQSHYQKSTNVGKRHYPQLSDMSKTQDIQRSCDNLATKAKVINDLMSSIPENRYHRYDRPATSKPNPHQQKLNTMHKTSYEAGLQNQHRPTISLQKKFQIIGNGLDKESIFIKSRRDDYRKSSFILG